MFGIAIEYTTDTGPLDPLTRADRRDALVRQPGYRRHLALVADCWRRQVDFFLYADADAARAALASAGHRDATLALLVGECPYGGPVTLLRTAPGPTRGGQACWRDQLTNAEPPTTLW